MDRSIVYPGQIPLETHILQPQQDAMTAIGWLLRAVLGTEPVLDGLALSPTVPPSMQVLVGPGSITQFAQVDAQAFGALGNNGAGLMKQGINAQSTAFTLTAPTTSGHAVNYLIQASFQESDSSPVVLPYYNAADPSIPYTGPGNVGTAQNTRRVQRVGLSLKAGASAPAGSQATPAADAGWIALYVLTVNAGQTSVTADHVAAAWLLAAPFIRYKLPQLTPGYSRTMTNYIPGAFSWTAPRGHTRVRVRAWGGGGGGGGTNAVSGAASGAGAAGGHAEGIYDVVPGVTYSGSVGAGGAGGAAGTNATGGLGGISTFGSFLSASGGQGGAGSAGGLQTAFLPQGGAGNGGTVLNLSGDIGGFPYGLGSGEGIVAASGGAAPFGAPQTRPIVGAAAAVVHGVRGGLPGGGGGGAIAGGAGGAGGHGFVILEW